MKDISQVKIVLASNSPRRKELLKNLGMEFSVRPANVEEDADRSLPPEKYVAECARQKADCIAKAAREDELIIAADTMVFKDNMLLGKPKSEDDARNMLTMLRSSVHQVYTGVSLYYKGKTVSETEITKVYFRDISDSEIDAYIKSAEPYDKAGAYGIQSFGALFAERIDGDFSNVIGLPICRLSKMLKEHFGFEILCKAKQIENNQR